jgi:hypothetical protein
VNIKRGTYEKGLYHKYFYYYLLSIFVIAIDSGKHSTAYLEMEGSNPATAQAQQKKNVFALRPNKLECLALASIFNQA